MEETTGSSTLPLFHSYSPPLPVKLLILSQEFPPGPGGLGTHAFEVARNLHRLGWDIRVVTHQDNASEESIVAFNKEQPFAIRRIPRRGGPVRSILHRWAIAGSEIRGFRPDLLMATGDRANYVAALLARRFRTPWVAIEHGVIPRGIERRIKRWTYATADALVCVSDYTWRQTEKMGVHPKRLEVIPNGADAERFRRMPLEDIAEFRESLGLLRKRILLTVGSVSVRKGQDTVIRALPRIMEDVPEATYLCAGVKLTADQFTDLASELGVGHTVRFLGPVNNEEVVKLMNAADIFLMTSRHTGDEFEGYGIAAVEAALCGIPSIVTGDSGLGEAIVDGTTGFCVPQNDPAAVAESVLRLLGDEGLRSTMGEAARIRALAEQTWQQRVARYDVLFRRLIEARGCIEIHDPKQSPERNLPPGAD